MSSGPPLRPLTRGPSAVRAPVGHVHLGLGSFFRAHQAVYTSCATDAAEWGIAAFSGRTADLATALTGQEGLYTLVSRAAGGDRFDVIDGLTETRPAADHDAWLRHLRSPRVAVLTITMTEAAYPRDARGGLDGDDPLVRADALALRRDLNAPMGSLPGRLVSGLAARYAAGGEPLALVPCDNLPRNGDVLRRIVTELADDVDPALADWVGASVSFVSSMVDRITPRTSDEDVRLVQQATGMADTCPVVTEPFTEWVLEGHFPAGRPRWEDQGAAVVADVEPFEQRKLWLLNGAHSLLAYAGTIRGHSTVAEAIGDDICHEWVENWWDEACRHLALPASELEAYRRCLLERFANSAMSHRLDHIAADGSQKLPVRVLGVLARERGTGRLPLGTARPLAAWCVYLRTAASVDDPLSAQLRTLSAGRLADAVPRLLAALDPELGEDTAVTTAVLAQAEELART